ncbi:ribbon-helix-helix protein, CopG family [bacterium]|nr:ribbon-helix-helix protein, CopG family [bacterium]
MSTTIRLSKETEKKISELAEKENLTKSDIIKNALDQFLNKYYAPPSPYELGMEYFDQYGSGRTDLSRNRKKILKEKLRAKNTH